VSTDSVLFDHAIGRGVPAAASVAQTLRDGLDLPGLLGLMRRGDREAAATFVVRYGTRIRRRIRGKLSPSIRRIFDSQDVLSSVSRQLDRMIAAGRLAAANEEQLWSLIHEIANHVVIDKARVLNALKRTDGEDGALARSMLSRLHAAGRDGTDDGLGIVEEALRLTPDEIDREILLLWLHGTQLEQIAVSLDMKPATVRKRWQMIRERLTESLADRTS
jgi:DNA-directed RNA polymerase specialized sigma24 family protein